MKKIKILHFISSLEMGGAQTVLYDLVTRLERYEHHVMYIHGGVYEQRYAQRAIPLYPLRGLIHSYDPLFYVRIARVLRMVAPDVMHTSLWAANWAGRMVGRLLNVPTVMALHNRAELNGPLRMMLDVAAPRAHSIIAVSDEVRNTFHTTYRASVQVIHNGVDMPLQGTRREYRDRLGVRDEHIVVGAVGRLHSVKRFDLLIRAFGMLIERYPLARLVILGTGSEEGRLRGQIAALGLGESVHLITGQNARPYYEAFDCFVLPSAREGISMALLEAMSARLACVVTHDEPTHPVITSGHDGLLCAGSESSLAAALDRVLTDFQWRAACGIQAHKTVRERLSIERMTHAYDRVFLALIRPHNTNSI